MLETNKPPERMFVCESAWTCRRGLAWGQVNSVHAMVWRRSQVDSPRVPVPGSKQQVHVQGLRLRRSNSVACLNTLIHGVKIS